MTGKLDTTVVEKNAIKAQIRNLNLELKIRLCLSCHILGNISLNNNNNNNNEVYCHNNIS